MFSPRYMPYSNIPKAMLKNIGHLQIAKNKTQKNPENQQTTSIIYLKDKLSPNKQESKEVCLMENTNNPSHPTSPMESFSL